AGPGGLAQPVPTVPVAPSGAAGDRVILAAVGDQFVALPLRGDAAAGMSFVPASGLVVQAEAGQPVEAPAGTAAKDTIAVRPIGPPRPTLVVPGCVPPLPLRAPRPGRLAPPVAFAWWPCGSQEALRLAAAGLVHAAGVHLRDSDGGYNATAVGGLPGGAEMAGFTAWRGGLAIRVGINGTVNGLGGGAKHQLRPGNREPGAEARPLLGRE